MASTNAGDYPALGFDPAPGDVDAVEEAASTVRSVMRTLEGAAEVLGGAPVAGWRGALATAFDDLFALELEPVVEACGVALGNSRRTLTSWATDLADLQRRARDLEVEAARAQQRTAVAVAGLEDVPVETEANGSSSTERRALAQHISRADEELVQGRLAAEALLEEYTDEGASVARKLQDAEETAPVDLRRLTSLAGVAAIVSGSMTGLEKYEYLQDHPEVAALMLELELRSEGLLTGPVESDAYRRWLENAARRGVPAETIVQIAREQGLSPDDFEVLDGLEEVTDRQGKSFFVLPDDISGDSAKRATVMTYIYNAGTDYGSASPDNDFPETPYSTAEVQRIIDRQEANTFSYSEDVGFVHANGGRLMTAPNGLMVGLGGNWMQDLYSQKGGTTYGDIFMLNIDDVDDPAEVLGRVARGGVAQYQDDDGNVFAGALDLDRLLHHEERHSQQWAEEGYSKFLASYGWEQLTGGNQTEEGAGLRDGGYR